MKKFLSVLAAAMIALSGCGATQGEPQVPAGATITSPQANAELVLGSPAAIVGKVIGSGVKSAQVVADGNVIATVANPTGPNEFSINQVWTPDAAGSHILQLKGLNEKGEVVSSTEVIFRVKAPPPTPAPVPTATAPVPPTATRPAVVPTATGPAPTPAPRATITVTNDFANLRSAPTVNASLAGRLNKGDTAPIIGKSEDGKWWQISLSGTPPNAWVFGELVQASGDTAGVAVVKVEAVAQATPAPTLVPTRAPVVAPTAAVTRTAPAVTPTAALVPTVAPQVLPTAVPGAGPSIVVTNEFVNVRSGPSTNYALLGRLEQNQTAPLRGKSEDGLWWQIAFGNGVGWVIGQYVKVVGDANAVPAVKVAPPPTTAAPTPNVTPSSTPTKTASAGGVLASAAVASLPDATSVSASVRTLMGLYNEVRAEAGLRPLAYSLTLARSAQAHAQDLVGQGRGSHTGSDGTNATQRIRQVGFDGRFTGENWAWARGVEQAFDMWFHQEPPSGLHRRSILSPNYDSVGIGIAASNGGYFIIANFGGK